MLYTKKSLNGMRAYLICKDSIYLMLVVIIRWKTLQLSIFFVLLQV